MQIDCPGIYRRKNLHSSCFTTYFYSKHINSVAILMLEMSVKCDGERRLDGGVKDETLDYLVANGTIKRQEGMSVLKHAAFNNRAGRQEQQQLQQTTK